MIRRTLSPLLHMPQGNKHYSYRN